MPRPARHAGAQTYLPQHTHRAQLTDLAALLQPHHAAGAPEATLDTPAGRLPLPPEIIEVLLIVAEAMARGLAVTVAPVHTTLTTQQATALDEMVERAEVAGLYDLNQAEVQKALHQARQRRVPAPLE